MSAKRLIAIARKELIQVVRDPRSLLIAVLMPIMQMVLLGYGISLDAKNIAVYAFDQEGSQQSQALLKHFQASPYFDLVRTVDSYRQLVHAVDADECKLGIVVPFDFSRKLRDSGRTSVQVIVDGSDDNTANLATEYARAVIGRYSADVQTEWIARQGGAALRTATLSLDARVWFNEDLESRNFIIPGVVALVLALVGALLTSLTVAREWERGTMEQLISTPVTAREVVLGKLIPYFGLGMADAVLCLIMAVGWFRVPFRGTVVSLFVATALFLIVVLGVGFMISVAIRSQMGASQIALLVTLLPTSLLSGYTFPIDQMPAAVRALTYLVYPRYYVTIVKAIFLKGIGLRALGFEMSALMLYAAATAFFAIRAFRKTLE